MNNFLAINWDVSPEIISIGPLALRWYALMFIIGFSLSYQLFVWFFKREKLPSTLLDPLLSAMILGTVLGARIGHCLFYDPMHYLSNPLEILMIWEGGLASHGGGAGVLLALWWFVRKYGKKYDFNYLWIVDRMCIVVALVGFFIRIGNLINSEIYGGPTDLPWGFIFERRGEIIPKHPTQLYEALAYLLTFLILIFIYKKYLTKIKRGFIFGLFLICIFVARFLIEYIKNPQVDFEVGMSYNMGQILSIPYLIIGILLFIYSLKYGKPAMLEHKTQQNQRAKNNPLPKKKKK